MCNQISETNKPENQVFVIPDQIKLEIKREEFAAIPESKTFGVIFKCNAYAVEEFRIPDAIKTKYLKAAFDLARKLHGQNHNFHLSEDCEKIYCSDWMPFGSDDTLECDAGMSLEHLPIKYKGKEFYVGVENKTWFARWTNQEWIQESVA